MAVNPNEFPWGEENSSDRSIQCLQTCAGDLMSVMLDQLKQMPDVWEKLSQDQQDQRIGEARSAVECAMREAIEHLNGLGVVKVRGELEQMTFKDGCKVVVKVPFPTADLMELATNIGGSVYIATYDLENAGAGHDEHRGDADQPGLPLDQYKNEED